jgi:hypothetical protein
MSAQFSLAFTDMNKEYGQYSSNQNLVEDLAKAVLRTNSQKHLRAAHLEVCPRAFLYTNFRFLCF